MIQRPHILILLLGLAFILTGMGCQEENLVPIAVFEADSTTIEQGSGVKFHDLSLSNPSQWNWRFEAGDPQVSTEKNPIVTYHHAGEYEVRLTVSNEHGTDVITRDNYILVLSPYPSADFTADTTVCEIDGIIRFTDISTGDPEEWFWTFQGGTPESSSARDPKVIYESPGTFSVVLTATNSRGTDTEAKEGFITVRYPRTDIWFHNHVFTEVGVTVGEQTGRVSIGDSLVFPEVVGYTAEYHATTSGKTSNGVIIGQVIYWSGQLNLNGDKMDVDLGISPSHFFLYISNHGAHNLTPLYVNFGSNDQSIDQIFLPADGTRYRIGYYPAHPDTRIRAYWQDEPASYTEWKAGTDFSFSFSENQSVHVTNRNR